jgi:cell fate regulator YaaT (PSP1 superfamily)
MACLTKVRYGEMRYHMDAVVNEEGVRCGDCAVVRTDRGVEVGTVLTAPTSCEGCDTSSAGEVIRKATSEDVERHKALEMSQKTPDFHFAVAKIAELNLPMKLVKIERLFGGGKMVFHFLSEGRVDFRDLVKELARQFHTRIEMKQIGVRDEARLLGDFETCGRELCCRTWIGEFAPVTMKMAKNQKTTLDPGKISGRCGRLKCCLRYEDDVYTELRSMLPRKGTRVETPKGPGVIVSYEILRLQVTVEHQNGERLAFHLREVSRLDERGDSRADN